MMLRAVLPLALLSTPFLLPVAAPPAPAYAQDADAVEFRLETVTPRISALYGSGGNIGVAHGPEGVLLIDDQYAELTDGILEQVRTLSDAPVRYVINTHWHGDHTGGNENLEAEGALIVAHDKVRERLSTDQYMPFFRSTSKARPAEAWPEITYADSMSLHWNGTRIDLHHAPAGHTDGDTIVHFVDDNVLHTGDLFMVGNFPFIDAGSGGSLDGMIDGLKLALTLCDDDTRIIPGHGEVSDRTAIEEILSMLETSRGILGKLVDRGLTDEEIVALDPLKDIGEVYGNGFIDTPSFTLLAAGSLSRARGRR